MSNYVRNLPHWRQPGCTYFLTFRLNDAVPQSVLDEMERERTTWLERLNRERELHRGDIPEDTFEDYQAFLVRVCRRLEKVMDEGHGSCLLRSPEVRQIVCDAMLFFEGDRCEMHGFVIMPNHVHVAVKPLGDWQPEQLLHSWKSFTSNKINALLQRQGQLWQEDTWNRIVRNEEHWFRVMRYLMRNPGNAGLLQGESTVWVAHSLLDSMSDVLREDSPFDDEPW